MGEPISIHAAKTHLSRLIARAEAGEEVVIARGNKPVVKLVSLAPKPKRKPGRWKGMFTVPPEFFEPLAEDELRSWYK